MRTTSSMAEMRSVERGNCHNGPISFAAVAVSGPRAGVDGLSLRKRDAIASHGKRITSTAGSQIVTDTIAAVAARAAHRITIAAANALWPSPRDTDARASSR